MLKDILHLKAPGNWMNDPNGFIYYKGEYHLFYQYFPYAPVWGTMHWGHAVSRDMIHWEHQKTAIFPSKEYDQNGIFSGSSIEKDGQLLVYYTGVRYLKKDRENVHVADGEAFESCQAMITSKDGYRFDNWQGKKQIIPVITEEDIADTVHTRDPKVWSYKNVYYMILGSTFRREEGRVLFYKSTDAVHWEYVNQYQNAGYGSIIECPDIFPVQGAYVFLGCPMDIVADGLQYTQHAVCTLADFQEEDCVLQLPKQYRYVDYGLDLYAPQTNVDEAGRRVMIGWMRMPKAVWADDREDWNGMMCMPRLIEVKQNHIYFRVHPNAEAFFTREIEDIAELDTSKPYRLRTELEEGEELSIGGYIILADAGRIMADRTAVFAGLDGYHMKCSTPKLRRGYHLDIYVEPHLIEIFVNDGEYVLSNVVYGLSETIKGNIKQIKAGG